MPTTATSTTPTPPKTPPTIRVSALLSTFIHLPFHTVFQDCFESHYPDSSGSYVPVLSFLLEHPGSGEEGEEGKEGKGKKVLFDLGVRKNAEGYPPNIPRVSQSRAAVSARKDVAELLVEGGIDPKDITHVIYSHLHWDHTGDPSRFLNASIVVGGGARSILFSPSSPPSSPSSPDEEMWVYPTNPLGTVLQFPEGMPVHFVDFDADKPSNDTENENAEEIQKETWHGRVISPFQTFEHAVDFFGDGSLYLVDTPGHYPGHISALARVSSPFPSSPPSSFSSSSSSSLSPSPSLHTSSNEIGTGSTYVFLGGDVCHNRQCYVPCGTRLMSAKIQWDVGRARESVGRVRRLCGGGFVVDSDTFAGEAEAKEGNENDENGKGEREGEVVVILAHEAERLEEGMPLFPSDLGEWAVWRAGKQRAARVSRRDEGVINGEH